VFVTAQARTLDLATVYAQGSGLLIVTSPGMREKLRQRLDKYIFPADQACCRPSGAVDRGMARQRSDARKRNMECWAPCIL
jgi:folate-binding Fe-S cluster repair protein YgfZ